jgi:WD40 repeat protein
MLVDLVTNESRAFGPAFRDEIDTVIMSPDKESVVVLTAGHVGEFPLLDIQREAACLKIGANYPRLHLEGDDYRTACYCGDLLAISADGKLLLHDPASGALTATLLGHSGKIVGAACVGDKPWLVTISLDMTVRLWDVQTLGPMGRFFLRGRGTFVAVSPDGSTIAAGDELGYVYLLQICGPRRKGSVEVTDSFVEFSAPAHGSASLPTPSEDWFVVGDLVFEGDPGPPAREIQCRRCGDKMIVDGTDWLHRRYPTACDSCGYQGA